MKKNNQNGITLVSLVVSIIIMLILASVTVTTSFTAYENAKAEKLKAQLKAIEEAVAEFTESELLEAEEKQNNFKARIHEKEQLESKLKLLEDLNASGTYTYTSVELNQMQQLRDKISEYTDVENAEFIFYIDDYDEIVRKDKRDASISYKWREWSFRDQLKKCGYPTEKADEYINISSVKNYPQYFDSEIRNWSRDDWWDFFDNYYPEVRDYYKYFTSAQVGGRSFEEVEASAHGDENVFHFGMLQNVNFYNFTGEEIETVFGLKDIDISVNIDSYNQVVLLAKPEKIDGEKIYSLRQLDSNASHGTWKERSPLESEKIRIDKVANYGTSQKIKLSLNLDGVMFDNPTLNYTDFKIRKAYYKTKQDNNWYEVDKLKECEYSEDGKSVTFIVYESGDYKFRIEDTSGATCTTMEQFTKFNIRTASTDDPANYEVITDHINGGYYNIILCNAPQLTSDMIPIKWIYEDESMRSGFWVVCTTIDPEWYNYSEKTKMWANAMFKKDSGKGVTGTFTVGEQVAESMLGSTFVWVPRYASRIDTTKETKLGYNVQFVKDTSNTTTFGTNAYASNLAIPVAFRNNSGKAGSWDAELKGLWFGKYDAGLEVEEYVYGYGGSYSVKNVMWDNAGKYEDVEHYFDKYYKEGQNFHAVSKPYHVAWGYLNFSSAFTQALMFYRNVSTLNEDKSANINSHMMKSTEYDVLQAITREPQTGTTSLKANTSNRYTGGSDGKNGFSVMNFTAQSSTGNITGIFDIAGTTEVMLSEWDLPYGLSTQFSYLINSLGQFLVYRKDAVGDITSLASNSAVENEDELIEFCSNYENKYFQITYKSSGWDSVFSIGETTAFSKETQYAGYLTSDYTEKKLDTEVRANMGYRIIIANSPSATTENFIYTNSNYIPNEECSGFFITDDFGNVIKTNDEYKDGLGNQTFFPMSQLLEDDYLRMEEHILKPGSKFDLLKQKTGKLNIALNGFVMKGDPYTDSGEYLLKGFEDGLFSNWNETSSGGKLLKVNLYNAHELEKISSRAFENCTNLQEVLFPKKLEEIGNRAFAGCQSLNNIQFPDTLKRIGGTDYTLGAPVHGTYTYTSTVGEVFLDCISLTSITIPNQVEIIGCKSFYGCTRLNSVVFDPSPVDKPCIISAYAFAETGITNLNFPNNHNAQIQRGAFANCEELTSVIVYSYGIHSLDYAAFAGCKKLEKFLLLDSYSYGDGCVYLLEDTFNAFYVGPASESGYLGAFQGCIALKEIDLSLFGGAHNHIIPANTFYGCKELGVENVRNLSSYIESIGRRAFLNCPELGKETVPITIPANVTIYDQAYGSDDSDNKPNLFIYYSGTYEQWQNLHTLGQISSKWLSNATAIITTSDGHVIGAESSGVGAVVIESE